MNNTIVGCKTCSYILLRYVIPGMYSPPVKPLRSTEYGSGSVDGEFGPWFGAMSPQAAAGAPIGRLCTDVVINKIAATKYIKLTAYD